MRIQSATLRNCRIHRELRVDFDPGRTLIGGPNETGKSTLIEAIHRALFLKARGNTEHHRALKSIHGGQPEVELKIEAEGISYVLNKKFGPAGTTTLKPNQQPALADEAAEAELARILKVEANVSGKTVIGQWAHLWVWQGQAGADPSDQATAQSSGLLSRLQQIGGAAAIQSELDARMANHFAENEAQIFTQAGKAKAGSLLEEAEQDLAEACQILAQARDQVEKLDSVATQLETATKEKVAAEGNLEILQKEQDRLEALSDKLAQLRQEETTRAQEAREAGRQLETLENTCQQVASTRQAISEVEQRLAPQQAADAGFEKARDEAKAHATLAEQAHQNASEEARMAHDRNELAAAYALLLERKESHAKLQEKAARIAGLQNTAGALEQQLAQLPTVEKNRLAKIQKLDREHSNARAAFEAMAAGIEVIASDLPVVVGGQFLATGQKQILTADTEVEIGSTARLRIQPGGGTSLAEARRAVEEAQAELRKTLAAAGLKSVQEAAEAYAHRDELGSQIKAIQAELQGMGADTVAGELLESQNAVAAAEGNVGRLAAKAPDLQPPQDKAVAKALIKQCRAAVDAFEAKEIQARAIRDQAVQKLKSAEDRITSNKTDILKLVDQLARLKGQLGFLLQQHGGDDARAQALFQAQTAKKSAANLLQATANAIAALQPDFLPGDIARNKRSIQNGTQQRQEAQTKIAVAQAALLTDGSEDPQAALSISEARHRSATEHHESVLREANAVQLLSKLFREEQKALAELFTQPLADRISGYLQCLFGNQARAKVELQGNEFTGLRLSRSENGETTFNFDALSGGAKEQTAAAVRLAMAEILAADYNGCLPVVFDDAFAYSDPERVQILQRMLDLAATRGLQTIVLTCNPADYAALGAKTIALSPARRVPPAPTMESAESPQDSSANADGDPDASEPPAVLELPVAGDLHQAMLKLLEACGGSKGNQTLRQELGWDDATYNKVKDDLVRSGKLAVGRGRGGSVALAHQM